MTANSPIRKFFPFLCPPRFHTTRPGDDPIAPLPAHFSRPLRFPPCPCVLDQHRGSTKLYCLSSATFAGGTYSFYALGNTYPLISVAILFQHAPPSTLSAAPNPELHAGTLILISVPPHWSVFPLSLLHQNRFSDGALNAPLNLYEETPTLMPPVMTVPWRKPEEFQPGPESFKAPRSSPVLGYARGF